MTSYFRIVLVFINLFMAIQHVPAQRAMKTDTTEMEIRRISDQRIRAYREQGDFDYRRNGENGKSLWDRFWVWFWEQVFRLSERKGVQKGFEIFIWIFAVALVLFAIYRLSGMEKRYFLRGSEETNLRFREGEEDIHAIDFEKAIDEAVQDKNYRLAIRLMYLRKLKWLADRDMINYRIDKTNKEYAAELSATPYAEKFKRMTKVFEYAWYGEFPVDHEIFEQLSPIFQESGKPVSA